MIALIQNEIIFKNQSVNRAKPESVDLYQLTIFNLQDKGLFFRFAIGSEPGRAGRPLISLRAQKRRTDL